MNDEIRLTENEIAGLLKSKLRDMVSQNSIAPEEGTGFITCLRMMSQIYASKALEK